MPRIFIIEDEPTMADCIALAVRQLTLPDPKTGDEVQPTTEIFYDAIAPLDVLSDRLPDAILLDVMLTGPDGFSFLNELLSYSDTARIPVVLISTLDLSGRNLEHYGVVQYLDKAKMTPEDINAALRQALASSTSPAGAGSANSATPAAGAPADSDGAGAVAGEPVNDTVKSPANNITEPSAPAEPPAPAPGSPTLPLSGLAALNQKMSQQSSAASGSAPQRGQDGA